MPDTFLENEDFWCNSAESSSSGSTALNASREKNIRHWMCLRNEVSIVFLPCTHQVLCSNFKTEGGFCPYCHVKIEESIKAYVPSSWIFPNWSQETKNIPSTLYDENLLGVCNYYWCIAMLQNLFWVLQCGVHVLKVKK